MATPREQTHPNGLRGCVKGDSVTLGIGDAQVPHVGAGWAAHVAYALGASSFLNGEADGTRARGLEPASCPTA